MEKINCRGHENRLALCEKYIIKPEFRIKMLKGIVISDSGGRITDELYIFSVYKIEDNSFYSKITCGEPTAKDFLTITGENRPPLFNMLKSTASSGRSAGGEKKAHLGKTTATKSPLYSKEDFSEWHPVNKVLYEAIMIMITVWGDKNDSGDSVLFRQMVKCRRYKSSYPYSDRIMAVNTIIGKDRRKTLAAILDSLKKAGNELRDFDLELLHEAVLKTGVKSNIL